MSTKLIYGVGINDADYNVTDKSGVKEVRCPFYIQWKNILARCYSPAFQRNQPRYKGCTFDDSWLSFMNFKAWMETQDWKGKALDKDILVEGNKHYGPNTTVYVDRETNMFFTTTKERELPRGVSPVSEGKWKAASNYGKVRYHGTFDTIEGARLSYEKVRYIEAIKRADKESDPRIAHILRTRFTPKF